MFDLGYPKRTGDRDKDYEHLYYFICEMSDRLKFELKDKTPNVQEAVTTEEQ